MAAPDSSSVITRCAPGKVVVWGEYAVLAGAPACVMAVDRFAEVTVQPASRLSIHSSGFVTPPVDTDQLSWTGAPVAALAETILQHWGYTAYPAHLDLEQDSGPFYQQADKLGIGSSAAVCVALYRALASHLQRPASLIEAMAIHRAFQGGSGSGLDIAASWLGGTIRFQQAEAQAMPWPADMQFVTIFTGQSAATPAYTRHFAQWQQQGDTSTLTTLCRCADELDHGFNMDNLKAYIAALKGFDQAAGLNIYTPAHTTLDRLAATQGLLYKPCGAGGGDIGMAFAQVNDDAASRALAEFTAAAAAQFTPLKLQIAQNLHTN